MNPWQVRWAPSASRSMRGVPAKMLPAVVAFVTGPLADNPLRTSKPLRAPLDGHRSARVGVYRVIVRLEEPDVMWVVRVEHRADVYRAR